MVAPNRRARRHPADKALDLFAFVAGHDPGVYVATIAHDDWCPALRGGECRCEPDVSIAPIPEDRGTA
jgi:hypothetical protein